MKILLSCFFQSKSHFIAISIKIENEILDDSLWTPQAECREAKLRAGQQFDIYRLGFNEFCLPPKCGTTSWQRALVSSATRTNKPQGMAQIRDFIKLKFITKIELDNFSNSEK